MKKKLHLYMLISLISLGVGCKETQNPSKEDEIASGIEREKNAILKVLNDETKAAFQRDYDAWQNYWVHDADITKTYLDFPENTFSESLGWEEIDQFVKTFFEEHPEPEPVPKLLNSINVRPYGHGA